MTSMGLKFRKKKVECPPSALLSLPNLVLSVLGRGLPLAPSQMSFVVVNAGSPNFFCFLLPAVFLVFLPCTLSSFELVCRFCCSSRDFVSKLFLCNLFHSEINT